MQSRFFYIKFTLFAFSSSILFPAAPPIASTVPKPTPIAVATLPAAGIALERRRSMPDIHQDSKHGMEHQKSAPQAAPASNPIPIGPRPNRAQSMTERVPHSLSSSAPSQYMATIYASPRTSPFASPLASQSSSPMNVPDSDSHTTKKEKNICLLISELAKALNRKNGLSPKNSQDLNLISDLLKQATDEVEKLKAAQKAKKDDAKNS